MKKVIPFVACIVCVSYASGGIATSPRWQPQDFEFKSSVVSENPFKVDFRAVVKGPNGRAFTALGFYDGQGVWKLRIAADTEGKWTLTTQSSEPTLNGKNASFVCVPNSNVNVHGGLRVDADSPHHFVYEDGTRYFLMGYECDWLWALDMDDEKLTRVKRFLDILADHRFNHIILNAYAHDCGWRKGKTESDDFGPPARYAWEGENDQPDHSRFNLSYWKHYDRVIHSLYERGIVAHIMIKVYNKMVRWPERGSADDDVFFKWMMARYGAYPNVVWDFSKEAHNEKDLEYKLSRFRLIRDVDPYRRLITNHDDNAAYDSGVYNELLSFRSDQQHSKWRETILRQRQQNSWPIVNVEFGYEWGLGGKDDKTYRVVQSPEEVCRRAWEICMGGGAIVYYYTNTAWDVIHPQEMPAGYTYFKNLYEFFAGTQYWLMQPQDIVSEGYCLANTGHEYIVFLNTAKPLSLKLNNVGKTLIAEWFHPYTGKTAPLGKLNHASARLVPPTTWGDGPVVLHAKAE
jgi:hypothetical protein